MRGSSLAAQGVGVVVVHFGDPAPTRACVASVLADPSTVARQVVVVDNSPGLGGPIEGASVVPSHDNPGYGEGVNRGVGALAGTGGWHAYLALNPDVELLPGFLDAAVEALADSRVGAAAGPLFLDDQQTRLWYAGGGVSFLTGTVWQSHSHRRAGQSRRVGFLPGAAMAIAPGAFRDVGGFDPAFFLYNEDLDLCLRLRRKAYQLRFVPGMRAVHRLGAATGSDARSGLYLENLSATRLRPFRPLANRLYLAVLHSGYVLLRAAVLMVRRGGEGGELAHHLLRGHWRALRSLRDGPRG